MPRSALIVGAGIGGLAAALALRRKGWDIRVFERAASPRELGFALLLAPNAIASLRELGLADEVIAKGASGMSAEIRRPDGRVLRRFSVSHEDFKKGPRAVVTLRPVLHGALLEAVGTESLQLGCEITGLEIATNHATIVAADGRRFSGDAVIGADGVASVVRRHLHPDEGPPRASRHIGIRGVAHDGVTLLGNIDGCLFIGDGIEAGVSRASATAVYWYVSLLASDVGPERDPRAVVTRMIRNFDRQLTDIVAATLPGDLRLDELFDRAPLGRWGTGPVTLLGDAAHPMLPHAGQGAAQALEDAVGLAAALGHDRPVAQSLRLYEDVRARRTTGIVKLARRIAAVTTTHNWAIRTARDTVVRMIPERALINSLVQAEQKDPNAALRA